MTEKHTSIEKYFGRNVFWQKFVRFALKSYIGYRVGGHALMKKHVIKYHKQNTECIRRIKKQVSFERFTLTCIIIAYVSHGNWFSNGIFFDQIAAVSDEIFHCGNTTLFSFSSERIEFFVRFSCPTLFSIEKRFSRTKTCLIYYTRKNYSQARRRALSIRPFRLRRRALSAVAGTTTDGGSRYFLPPVRTLARPARYHAAAAAVVVTDMFVYVSAVPVTWTVWKLTQRLGSGEGKTNKRVFPDHTFGKISQ